MFLQAIAPTTQKQYKIKLDKFLKWKLTGTEKKKDTCGIWNNRGCDNVWGHPENKVFVRRSKRSCFRSCCEYCWLEKWLARESHRATQRIENYIEVFKHLQFARSPHLQRKYLEPIHVIVSPSWKDKFMRFDLLKKKARKLMEQAGIEGGLMIYHPFAFDKKSGQWVTRPHFHVVGFGWVVNTKKISDSDGWVIKNKGLRDNLHSTIYYQLSHAGVSNEVHSITWFGSLGYRAKYSDRFKVDEEDESSFCDYCGIMLVDFGYFGIDRPPDYEFVGLVDSKDWKPLETLEEAVARELNDYDKVYDSIQGYYDNSLTKYNHCMGIKPDSLSKEPVYKSSAVIIKDEAHKQCEVQWEKHSIFMEGYYGYESGVDTYQVYLACIEEHSSDIEPYIANKCDEIKPYDIEEWYLTGNTFDQWNECQINAASSLYQSQPVTNSDIVCGEGDIRNVLGQCVSESGSESMIESTISPDIICGTGTVEKNGQCVVDINYKSTSKTSSKGGGCLIATATYGTELSPQVQQLRELRDNQLLNTESGTSFMESFNDFYYSFSPIIADYERENPVFREMVKIAITPMISSLSVLNYVDMNSEVEVLGYGISLIILNGMMYVGIPILAIMRLNSILHN